MKYRTRCPLFVATMGLLACAPHKPATTPAPPPPPAVEGKTAYAFLFDPANPALGLPSDVRFDRPQPLDTKTLPIYPERALAARFGPHHEVVRIVIDTKGHVAEIHDSPLAVSDGDAYAEEFRRAVEAALRTWTFTPGSMRHVVDGKDLDGDGKPDYVITKSWEYVPVYYDVRFTFEIVEGKGLVRHEP